MQAEARSLTPIGLVTAWVILVASAADAGDLPRVVRAGVNSPAVAGAYNVAVQKGTRVLRPDLVAAPGAPAKNGREGTVAGREMDSGAAAMLNMKAASARNYDRLVQSVWREHGHHIRAAAARHHVSEDLILAVVAIESAGRPDAVSPKGAQGLMQLMPATAARFGVRNAFEPANNIDAGTALLSHLSRLYMNDPVLTLAAYNAGEGAVSRYGGVPPFAETQAYIPSVLGAAAAAKRLSLVCRHCSDRGALPAEAPEGHRTDENSQTKKNRKAISG